MLIYKYDGPSDGPGTLDMSTHSFRKPGVVGADMPLIFLEDGTEFCPYICHHAHYAVVILIFLNIKVFI